MSSNCVNTVVNLLQKTSGRDKIARAIQYGSLFFAWLIEKWKLESEINDNDVIKVLINISKTTSEGRKLFRLGGFIEQLKTAIGSIILMDSFRRALVILAKLCSAGYLAFDNIVWACSHQLLTLNIELCKLIEFRFWLCQILLSIIRDYYEWYLLSKKQNEYNRISHVCEVTLANPNTPWIYKFIRENSDLLLDTVTNHLDIFIPLNKLGYTHFPNGFIGLVGLITSFLRLFVLVSPTYKLPFS